MDQETTFQAVKKLVEEFVGERDWQKYHSPKNISMALAIEAAELMEHFQWLTIDESRKIDSEKKAEVGEEMADVACYLFALANTMQFDLSDAILRKMEKNRIKYPVERYLGNYKVDDLPKDSPKKLGQSTD